MAETFIGIDLGGTQIRAVLASADGTVLARYRLRTAPGEGRDAVLQRLVQAANAVVAQAGGARPQGVGLASAGLVDVRAGTVLFAANLGWSDVPVRRLLEERLRLPVVVANDARAAALGEWRFGAGRGASDLVYITVGTGIGGGIVSAGRLLLGARGLAGEIGHVTVEPDGAPCACGGRGCLEALASGPAIARAALARIEAGQASTIPELLAGDLGQLTAQVVAHAALAGDELAKTVVHQAARYIGIALANLVHTLEPQIILIGGGVAQTGDLLFDAVRAAVRERTIAGLHEGVRIQPAALGDDAGALGAAALSLEYGHD